MISLEDKFVGSLLGLAVGDALGGCFEAQSADWICHRYSSVDSLIYNPPRDELYYTDDTQMTIGLAETLIENHEILEEPLCNAFVANYHPSRGYGRGARAILEAMEEKRDYRNVAETYFSGGSYGNGAAMRVAPVGLFFHHNLELVWNQAKLSALPTHLHSLGIEGAQILATAVALCISSSELNVEHFFGKLMERVENEEFRTKLKYASKLKSVEELKKLGNGIEAINSVPTAIATFVLFSDSYAKAIGEAIFLGGDTDTIAAMTGALSGAYLGIKAIPKELISKLEDTPKGIKYLLELAKKLFENAKKNSQ